MKPLTAQEQLAQREAFETNLISNIRRINDFALDFGCFFAVTQLTGSEVDGIDAYISHPECQTDTPAEKYQVINDWFTAIGYHPFVRAYFVYRSQRTPHVKEFSHHIERALLLYYKGDFFSAVQVLMPAIEGVLRSYVGANMSTIGMKLVDLIPLKSQPLNLPYMSRRHAVYKEMLERFLREWFFANTKSPNLGSIPSKMNRNYIAHLLGSESFYRPADCNRLFAFFDILLEIIAFEEKEAAEFVGLLQEGIPEVTERHLYYIQLMLSESPWRAIRANEDKLLGQNPNYESQPLPDWLSMTMALEERQRLFIHEIMSKQKPTIFPFPPGNPRNEKKA